jgi:hypothetical protein
MPKPLVLVREAKLASLLPAVGGGRLEASGVLAADGRCYVIFDDRPDVARLAASLSPAGAELIRQPRGRRGGFEDIAHDPAAGRFYVLVEARPRGRGYMAEVQEYDERFGYLGRAWLEFPLDGPNKGLEGLTCVHRQGRTCWACARATGAGTARRAGGPAGAGSGCSSAADTVVVVSDRAKRDGQDARCRAKDQSIHVFTIPAG